MLTHLLQNLLPPHPSTEHNFLPASAFVPGTTPDLSCRMLQNDGKNPPHFLLLSQRTKTFGECSCQLLTGSGLMNEKTFQELIKCIVS